MTAGLLSWVVMVLLARSPSLGAIIMPKDDWVDIHDAEMAPRYRAIQGTLLQASEPETPTRQ